MIAKVDSRSVTETDQRIKLAIDIMHSHLFDKETELSILEGEGTKAYVPVVENERRAARAAKQAEEEAKKAELAAQKAAAAEAKKAAAEAKKNEKSEKKD